MPLSAFQPKQMRLVVEKATELGVAALHPVVTQRVQGRKQGYEDEDETKQLAVAIEAAEQSDRLTVPSVEQTRSLEAAVAGLVTSGPVSFFVCEERSEATVPLLDALAADPSDSPAVFLIGPEGGWAPGELDRVFASLDADRCRLWRVSLGAGILRAETASLYALATWNAFRHSRK